MTWWAISACPYRQVPEGVFNDNPTGVGAAVLALPDKVVASLRDRMDAARYSLLWNDRTAPEEVCVPGKGAGGVRQGGY
jgi:hypothetical protein